MMYGLSLYAPRTPQNNVVCQRLQLRTKMGVYFARTEATPRRASTLYGGVRGGHRAPRDYKHGRLFRKHRFRQKCTLGVITVGATHLTATTKIHTVRKRMDRHAHTHAILWGLLLDLGLGHCCSGGCTPGSRIYQSLFETVFSGTHASGMALPDQ